MKVSNLICSVLVLALVFALAVGCTPVQTAAPAATPEAAVQTPAEGQPAATEAPAATASALDRIKASGKLVLGTSPDWPPYEFPIVGDDGKEKIVGFDIMIAEEIAKDIGVPLEIMPMDFDGLIPALQVGTVDIVLSGMTATDERKQSVNFSKNYYLADQKVVVRKSEVAQFTDLNSFNGKKIGVQMGATQEALFAPQLTGANVVSLKNVSQLIMELKGGGVDGVIIEGPVADSYVAQHPDLTVSGIAFEQAEDDIGSAVGIALGADDLVALVNSTIDRITSSGELEQFVVDATLLQEQSTLE